MDISAETPPRKRFQFALRSLVLTVITAGSLMGFIFSRLETSRLRAENRELREELGCLIVDDPTKLYARSLPVNDQHKWRWRIYFPTSRRYVLNFKTYQIQENGFDRSGSINSHSFTVDKGEYTVEIEARKTGPKFVEIHAMFPQSKTTINAETKDPGYNDWMESSTSNALDKESKVYDSEKPLELLRLRAMKIISPGSSSTTPAPSPGLLVWIEPETPATTGPTTGSAKK